MIVREIKDHPELLDDFDWFNDYKDTRQWATHAVPELVPLLDEGNQKYWDARRPR